MHETNGGNNAIPTSYKGINFRSRIEAKWAAFFDLLGWSWEYEPIDLKGYIPDFILNFYKPLLVEVKSELSYENLAQYGRKIVDSGWDGDAIVVGARLFLGEFDDGDNDELISPGTEAYDGWYTVFIRCQGDDGCGCVSLTEYEGFWNCKKCGHYPGGWLQVSEETTALVKRLWAEAGNTVQWNRRRSKRDDAAWTNL